MIDDRHDRYAIIANDIQSLLQEPIYLRLHVGRQRPHCGRGSVEFTNEPAIGYLRHPARVAIQIVAIGRVHGEWEVEGVQHSREVF